VVVTIAESLLRKIRTGKVLEYNTDGRCGKFEKNGKAREFPPPWQHLKYIPYLNGDVIGRSVRWKENAIACFASTGILFS